jgi:MoxR-like ATPase
MHYIDREAELGVLAHYPTPSLEMNRGLPKVSREEILQARRAVRNGITLLEPIRAALVDLARALRADQRVLQGASTRSLVLMLPALQSRALMHSRDYVSPEDIELLAPHVFRHRIECVPGLQDSSEVITSCMKPHIEQLARSSLRR